MSPRVSVIIPVFNDEDVIAGARRAKLSGANDTQRSS